MSNFGYAGHGFSLKALLEDPSLQTAPSFNNGGINVKKQGKVGSHVPSSSSAFLGSNIWDKPVSGDGGELDLEYMDLDEFLSENGIPVNLDENDEAETISLLASALAKTPPQSPQRESSDIQISPQSPIRDSGLKSPVKETSNVGVYLPESPVNKPSMSPLSLSPIASPRSQEPQSAIERYLLDDSFGVRIPPKVSVMTLDSAIKNKASVSPSKRKSSFCDSYEDNQLVTIPGQENFDPTSRKFSEEELKPQPIIKKSKKVFVDEHSKDDRYWQRRKKNNIAAKRSRDARRVKENQIAMRASFLENENDKLRDEVDQLQRENEELIKRLSKYEKV